GLECIRKGRSRFSQRDRPSAMLFSSSNTAHGEKGGLGDYDGAVPANWIRRSRKEPDTRLILPSALGS
ncbi:MAG TPA: hypothetical protein VKP30_31115, partial [Polyangiaceae bacterium]|nr:hypothetical protein [Polyangiaceae bacterium]